MQILSRDKTCDFTGDLSQPEIARVNTLQFYGDFAAIKLQLVAINSNMLETSCNSLQILSFLTALYAF